MKLACATIAVLLAGIEVGSAQDKQPQQLQQEQRQQLRQRLLERFDKDKDGKLSPSEREEARKAFQQRFGQTGRNKGRAGRAQDARKKGQGAKPSNRRPAFDRQQLMRRFDSNRNGRLDPPEMAQLRAALGRMNANRPANRAGGDRKNQPQRRFNVENLLKRFDANGNGRLDPDELEKLRSLRQRFGQGQQPGAAKRPNRVDRTALLKKFDENGNGKLDPAERQQALAEMKRNRDKN